MKQTKKYLLNLMEAADALSAKPLNENAEKIEAALLAQKSSFDTALLAQKNSFDAALLAQKNSFDTELLTQQRVIADKLMMATGKYDGEGTRSVTIQTPGFKAKALMIRYAADGGWMRQSNEAWWVGGAVPVSYSVTSETATTPAFARTYKSNITFVATNGSLSWSVPELPPEHYNISADERPYVVCNEEGRSYEWIAFGAAEE